MSTKPATKITGKGLEKLGFTDAGKKVYYMFAISKGLFSIVPEGTMVLVETEMHKEEGIFYIQLRYKERHKTEDTPFEYWSINRTMEEVESSLNNIIGFQTKN